MPDKQLTEAAWKTFAKGGSYKDAPLLKALAALDKADKSGAQAELDALDELDKQADVLRKANKSDKPLGDYLDTLDKALAKQRKTSESNLADEKKAADKKAADKASDSDDEESPALLTTKMLPLLREVRKGNSVMQTLIAVAGKETVVLLSRRSISPARGKLLKEQMTVSGGIKFIRGECLFEDNAVTFVVQSSAAGLAKKLKSALADQTGMKLKVRVRGEDPTDTDEEGEDAETADTEDDDAKPGAGAGAQAQPDGVKAPNPQAQAFDARLGKLEPLLADALKDKLANAARMRAVTDLAKQKAATGAYASAMQALDAVDRLLAEAGADAPAGTAQPTTPTQQADTTVDPSAAFNARLAALMPKIKEALAAAGPNGQGLKLKVSEAGALARQKRFEQGHAVLDEAEELLGAKASTEPDADGTSTDVSDEAAQFAQRLQAIEDDYQGVLKLNPANASALRVVMAYASEQADGGQHAKALAALDRLAGLLATARATATSGQGGSAPDAGLVAYRKTLLDFRQAAATVDGQISSLKQAIPSQLPDEAELADELAEELAAYTSELLEAVDDAMNAADNASSPITQALADKLQAYADDVAASDLVKHVDSNPFGVTVSVASTLGQALNAIRKAMPVPAG